MCSNQPHYPDLVTGIGCQLISVTLVSSVAICTLIYLTTIFGVSYQVLSSVGDNVVKKTEYSFSELTEALWFLLIVNLTGSRITLETNP